MTAPRHLLLDADGVVQDLPGGWVGALTPPCGSTSSSIATRLLLVAQPGAAKPGVDFFAAVLGALGSSPRAALLVDDSPRNVAAAREVGLLAEHWHHDDGVPALRSRLAAHGLPA